MALAPGTRLGPYEIVASLGAGGMGEVYRARDPKLNRDVAIKVLPPLFAADADRLARFTREAQALAALNHPNIAGIYEMTSGVFSGPASTEKTPDVISALVMELVEGRDLSQIIAAGLRTSGAEALQCSDAIAIARQIASALEAAHDAGIVHRDLKPANIKVRADGTVKVLDFGLAKAMDPNVGRGFSRADPAEEEKPTMTSPAMTAMGMILGTAAYMSPEQARGKPVDKRADIWAFGVVLFEMLTGKHAFAGETVTDVMAAVVSRDPDWSALPAGTPLSIRRLLKRALTKDPKQRLHDIGDARLELDEALQAPVDAGAGPGVTRRRLAIIPLALVATVTAAVMWLALGTRGRSTDVIRDVGLPPEAPITFTKASPWGGGWRALAVSPNADFVVYVADRGDHTELWVKSLVTDEAHALPGTEDAYMLALHPDGDRVAFITGRSLKVTTLKTGDAAVRQIAEVARASGLAWLADDRLLVPDTNAGTFEVFDATGRRTQTTTGSCFNPFPISVSEVLCGNDGPIGVVNIVEGKRDQIDVSGSMVALVTPTSLAFSAWDGTLMIAPWSASERRAGQSHAMPLRIRTEAQTGSRQAAISSTGTMVFVPGPHAAVGPLVRRQNNGELVRVPLDLGFAGQFDVNPDGRRLAVTSRVVNGMELAVYDMVTGQKTVWFAQPNLQEPRWSPDGSRLIVRAGGASDADTAAWVGMPSSGLPPVRVTGPAFSPSHWYDEHDLLGTITTSGGIATVRVRLDGTVATVTPHSSAKQAGRAVLSPSRRLVAVMSNDDVVVETFPDVLKRVIVGRGLDPLWLDERTLSFRDGITWYRATVEPDGTMTGVPRAWFSDDRFVDTTFRSHALTPKGEVLYLQSASPPTFGYLRVIPGWTRTIK